MWKFNPFTGNLDYYEAGTGAVTSVNGATGVVVLDSDDIDDTDKTHLFVSSAEKSGWDGKQAALVSGTNIKTVNGNSLLGSGDLVISSGSSTKSVEQTGHGFSVGDAIRSSGTDNAYAKAQADSAVNAEVVGIVTAVADINNFTYSLPSLITTAAAVPNVPAGTPLFLSPTSAGALTSTEPTNAGHISKPVAIVTIADSEMLFVNMRGMEITAAGDVGITRSINSVSTETTAGNTASTDYVYLVSGTTTINLPTAVGNTNRYTIKNVGVNTVTIATNSTETIDGSDGITLPVQYTSIDLVSDNSNWLII